MRMHILTCENITIGPKELRMRSFMWGDQILGWTKTSLDWPKGRDDAIMYVRWYESRR
jgi:hypothetical protein